MKKLCAWFEMNDKDKDCFWSCEEFVCAYSDESNAKCFKELFCCKNTETKEQLTARFKAYDVHGKG